MSTIKGKATFEFTIQKSKETEGKNLYSPIFSTSNNTLWQLEYHPNDPIDSNCCLIFLTAIPNSEEATTTQLWSDRTNISASLFLKSPGYIKSFKINTDNYSLRSKSWGNNFDKITRDSFTIGVTFENSSIETRGYNFNSTPNPNSNPNSNSNSEPNKCGGRDIIETWSRQLDVPENSDVIFNVKDGIIYANKSILSSRSEYFSNFFKGRWSEISNSEQKSLQPLQSLQQSQSSSQSSLQSLQSLQSSSQSSLQSLQSSSKSSSQSSLQSLQSLQSSQSSINDSGHIVINVPDVSKLVFMEMLRYLYTDEVRFNLVPTIEIFRIADKYLLTNLRQKARVEIFKRLTEKNAMNILFKEAWKWNDLKDDIMDFIIDHFQSMKDTPEYKKLADEHKGHPAGIEIFQELLDRLINKQK